MSIGGMLHFRRNISCKIGIIPAFNPQDELDEANNGDPGNKKPLSELLQGRYRPEKERAARIGGGTIRFFNAGKVSKSFGLLEQLH